MVMMVVVGGDGILWTPENNERLMSCEQQARKAAQYLLEDVLLPHEFLAVSVRILHGDVEHVLACSFLVLRHEKHQVHQQLRDKPDTRRTPSGPRKKSLQPLHGHYMSAI